MFCFFILNLKKTNKLEHNNFFAYFNLFFKCKVRLHLFLSLSFFNQQCVTACFPSFYHYVFFLQLNLETVVEHISGVLMHFSHISLPAILQSLYLEEFDSA